MRHLFLKISILFIMVFFVISNSIAQENIIIDPSFEQSPHIPWSDWKDWGPGKHDFDNTEKVHSGAQSYKVTVSEAAFRWNSDIALQEDITDIILGGDKFETSAYLLIPEDSPLSEYIEAYLEVIFLDGKGKDPKNEVGKFQSKKYGYGKPQPQWTKLIIEGAVPLGAKDCKLQLVVLPLPYLSDDKKADETYSGVVYFDDVSFVNKSKILR